MLNAEDIQAQEDQTAIEGSARAIDTEPLVASSMVQPPLAENYSGTTKEAVQEYQNVVDLTVVSSQTEQVKNADVQQEQVMASNQMTTHTRKSALGETLYAINRPWILVTIPLLVGGFWLVNNTQLITENLNRPYALAVGPVAILSILAGWLVFKFFSAILSWAKHGYDAFLQARKEDGSAQFFWLVIIVFMVVSVFASGSFFSILERDALPGLGYATALFIDLVAVQAMRARLNAVRMRNVSGANLYLAGVLLCSGASAFANVYTSLANFDGKVTGALPAWMLYVAPWFGLVFPVMILLLSITADYTIDQISTKLDPDHYKQQEEKRVKLLEIQRDMLVRRAEIEQDIDRLSTKQQNRKPKRVFFLVNWLFPMRQIQQSVDTQEIVNDVVNQMRPWFEFLEEKFLARQQIQGNSLLNLQKNIEELDNNIQLIMVQNFQNTFSVSETLQPQKQSSSENNISSDQEEKAVLLMRRRGKIAKKQLFSDQKTPKSLNFKPNAFHRNAVQFLQKTYDVKSYENKIRLNAREGFEALATLFRQQEELNYSFVTAQFAAEAWFLFSTEKDKKNGDEQRLSSQIGEKIDRSQAQNDGSHEATSLGGLLEPVLAEKTETQQNQNTKIVSKGSLAVTDKVKSAANSWSFKNPNADLLTKNSNVSDDETDTNSERSEHQTEELQIIGQDIHQILARKNEEYLAASRNLENSLFVDNSQSADHLFKPFVDEEEDPQGNSDHQTGSLAVDDDASTLTKANEKNVLRRGPYSMSIEEVAEKFGTTIPVVEDAIVNGSLKLAKRGQKKILVSSLGDFSPPQKRSRAARGEKRTEASAVVQA